MKFTRFLMVFVASGVLSGCLTLPKTKDDVRTMQPQMVTVEFNATLPEVMDSFTTVAKTCGKVWRRTLASMVGWGAAPHFIGIAEYGEDGTSATFEIWSMNVLSPDYIFELFEMRSRTDGVVEVIQYQGKAHNNNGDSKGVRPTHIASWYPPNEVNCW